MNTQNDTFNTFGYTSNKGCDICGNRPAKIEPRFGYISCKEHSALSPVEFSKKRKNK